MRNFINNQSNMIISASMFFSTLSDREFIMIAEAGELKNLCNALSIDLHSKTQYTYEA